MGERLLTGTPAAPGVALGTAWRPSEAVDSGAPVAVAERDRECDNALAALAAAAQELLALAADLPRTEGEIVETGALMGQDPGLLAAVEGAIRADGLPATEAIVKATREYADAIASIADETLAARADDVRSLGRRAARLAAGRGVQAPPGADLILIAHDLGPGDVAELAQVLAGVVLAAGGPTAHAAIVARSLGVPMVTGLAEESLEIDDGAQLVIDGSGGSVILDPSDDRIRKAANEAGARRRAARRAYELRDQPAVTTDDIRITVLANVATAEELDVGLRAGAEGIGLLRTELAFLDARDWPTEAEHYEALAPILAGLGDRPAVVRVLDFGADKSPPFLQGVRQRGIELLLAHPDAFAAQLRAILQAAQRHDVRILLPMVQTPDELAHSIALINQLAGRLEIDRIPPLGSMIETPAAADNAVSLAGHSDFFSIGTNDLTATTVGADRFAANAARAHDPRVLRSIAHSVTVAHEAGIRIEVCGEAASDPIMLPLLVGLGVDEVSVGGACVGTVRHWIRQLNAAQVAGLARSALTMDDADEVESATRGLAIELQSDGAGHARNLSAA